MSTQLSWFLMKSNLVAEKGGLVWNDGSFWIDFSKQQVWIDRHAAPPMDNEKYTLVVNGIEINYPESRRWGAGGVYWRPVPWGILDAIQESVGLQLGEVKLKPKLKKVEKKKKPEKQYVSQYMGIAIPKVRVIPEQLIINHSPIVRTYKEACKLQGLVLEEEGIWRSRYFTVKGFCWNHIKTMWKRHGKYGGEEGKAKYMELVAGYGEALAEIRKEWEIYEPKYAKILADLSNLINELAEKEEKERKAREAAKALARAEKERKRREEIELQKTRAEEAARRVKDRVDLGEKIRLIESDMMEYITTGREVPAKLRAEYKRARKEFSNS